MQGRVSSRFILNPPDRWGKEGKKAWSYQYAILNHRPSVSEGLSKTRKQTLSFAVAAKYGYDQEYKLWVLMSRIHILALFTCASHLTFLTLCTLEIIKLIYRLVVKLKGSNSKVPGQATGRGIIGRERGLSFRSGNRELFHKLVFLVLLLFIFI